MGKVIQANKFSEMINKKMIKNGIKIFDDLKEITGIPIERMKLPLEFENIIDYENHCKEYVKKYSDDITEYANRLFFLNEKTRADESKGDAFELYALLMGLQSFLLIRELETRD